MPTTNRPLRVLQISDPHLFAQRTQTLLNIDTRAALEGVVRHILQDDDKPDIVLATGDITQDGSVQACEDFLELARPIAPVLRGLPGNHDSDANFYAAWGDDAQAITDLQGWRIVMLNSTIEGSSAGNLAADQLDLLRQAASDAGDRHILVALHHNPVPVGSAWMDTMMVDNSHALLEILGRHPAIRAVIWGHVHQEYDSVCSFGTHRVELMATPATCLQFAPRSPGFKLDFVDPGYRRLDLHPDGKIDTRVVRVPGLNLQPDAQSTGY